MKTCSKNKKGKKAGFTFVEILFAFLLLSILAIVAVSALTYPRYLAIMTVRKQAAIDMANEVLESAMGLAYSDKNLQAGSETMDAEDHFNMHGGEFTVTRVIELVAENGGTPEHKLITVTVGYPGSDDPVVLQTLKTEGN